MNEQEYLKHQAEQARAAMADAARRLSDHFGKGVNPLHWTRDYPKTAVSIAALAGALAANTIVPPKGGRKPSKIMSWLSRPPEPHNGDAAPAPEEKQPKFSYISSLLVTEAMSVAGHILGQVMSAVTEQLFAKAPPIRPANPPEPDSPKTPA